jgi:hypothetical protein
MLLLILACPACVLLLLRGYQMSQCLMHHHHHMQMTQQQQKQVLGLHCAAAALLPGAPAVPRKALCEPALAEAGQPFVAAAFPAPLLL